MKKNLHRNRATSWRTKGLALVVLSALGTGCGENKSEKSLKKEPGGNSNGAEFALTDKPLIIPGHPVVKVVKAQEVEFHWLLTETITAEGGSYALDHARQVRRLKDGKVEEITLGSKFNKAFITDIAAGPKANQLLVSSVLPNTDGDKITHALTLYTVGDNAMAAAANMFILNVDYPAKTTEARDFAFSYQPRLDTHDVGRLASKGNKVLFVGRETHGVPFFVSLKIEGSEFTNVGDGVLGPRLSTIRTGMISGTYDTNQQMSLPYKIHIAWNEENPVVVLPVHKFGVESVLKYFDGIEGIDLEAHEHAEWMTNALVIPFTLEDEPVPGDPKLRMFGSDEALIHGVTTVNGQPVVYGQDQRIGNRAFWNPVVMTSERTYRRDLTAKAIDVRTVLQVDDQLLIAGAHDWSQNPSGLSVSGGSGYIGTLSKDLETATVKGIKALPQARTEVRQLFEAKGRVCMAGITGGPDTHRADGDLSKLKGDGFILCKKEDQ